MTYYEKLRQLRESRGFTSKDIADILGLSPMAYSNYELGKREIPYNVLVDLADIYKVSLDYLFGRTTIKEPYPFK